MRTNAHQVKALVFVVALMATGTACNDATAPAEPPGLANQTGLRGTATSVLWGANGQTLSYIAAASTLLEMTKVAKAYKGEILQASELAFSPAKVDSLTALVLAASPLLKRDDARTFAESSSNGGSSRPILRPTFKGRSINSRTVDGQDLRVQVIDDPRGGGRPPAALAIYVSERIVAYNRYVFTRDGTKWRAVEVKVTTFDRTGRVSATTIHDLREVFPVSSSRAASMTPGQLREGADWMMTRLCEFFQPTPLYAASTFRFDPVDDGAPCFWERVQLGLATGAAILADGAVVVACGSCALTGGTCPGCIGAIGAAALANTALAAAAAQLTECLQQHIANNPPGGGGGGSPEEECWEVVLWISFDDGWTWHFLDSWTECVQQWET